MSRFALNHMTLAKGTYTELLATAAHPGCEGVGFRTDLEGGRFHGMSAAEAGRAARDAGRQVLAAADVCALDDVHELKDPLPALPETMAFMRDAVQVELAR